MTISPGRAKLIVFAAALLAFSPALTGEFLDLDDTRFVRDNPALDSLDVGRFLTDPASASELGSEGIYRPLRTLDFAIDRVVFGGAAWVYHLRSLLYHALASLLVLALFSRLTDGRDAALAGALLFAVHPLQAESVAWITSRSDVLLLVLVTGALVLHVDRRRIGALACLAAALLAKESAVVVPVLAVLVDRLRGEKLRWRDYALQAGLVLLYLPLRLGVGGASGHLSVWWGGSYGANLLTVLRGLVWYARLLLFPVGQRIDEHVPGTSGFDPGAILGLALLAGLVLLAVRGGRRARFVLLFVAATMLPTSNLLVSVGIPTSARFLYLPMVGIGFGLGSLLARSRRLAIPVLGVLLVLAFVRSLDWRTTDALYAANGDAVTPRTLLHRAHRAASRAEVAEAAGDTDALARETEETIRLADTYRRYHPEVLGVPADRFGGARILVKKAFVLVLSNRLPEARDAALESLSLEETAPGHYVAFLALQRLAREAEAEPHLRRTVELLETRGPGHERELRRALADLFNGMARRLSAAGDVRAAREVYGWSWRALPDSTENAEARRHVSGD